MSNGLFLVRTKDAAKGAYVLSMVVQRQPIHHLLERDESSAYLVNGQQFGSYEVIADLIKAMRVPSFVLNFDLFVETDFQRNHIIDSRGCSLW